MAARRPIGAWFLAALWVGAAPAACLFNAEVPDGPCKADEAACDDGNPCTVDVCNPTGFCDNTPSDSLVPDDGNPCTEDKCVEGVKQNTVLPDGEPCGLNDQLSCVGGKCNCASASECGVDTECQTFSCTTDGCQSANVADGTFVDGAEEHDCKQRVCETGKIVTVVDTSDPGPDPTPGDCRTNACDMTGKVVDVPATMDFPADMVAGDCQRKACTLDGNVEDVAAPDDAPGDDNNPCTSEGCDGGTPIVNEPANEGMLCGAAAACGAAGSAFSATTAEVCAGGSCTIAASMSCGLYKCNGAACHTSCTDSMQCVAGTYCDNGQCKQQAGFGSPCSSPAQCGNGNCVDGFCCNSPCDGLCEQCDLPGALGVCSPVPTNTDPDNDCPDDNEVCNGSGQCKRPNGEPCGADGDCLTGQCEDGYCCNSDCSGDCRTCNQTGSLGTCKDVPLNETSGACSNGSVCNGSGSCKKLDGQPCSGGSQCLSGFCPDEAGGTDVCCDTACNNDCRSCIGARTVGGADGVCDFVKIATDPNNDCSGTCNMANGKGCCDGAGVCVPP